MLARLAYHDRACRDAVEGVIISGDALGSGGAVLTEGSAAFGGEADTVAGAVELRRARVCGNKLVSGIAVSAAVTLRVRGTDRGRTEDARRPDITRKVFIAGLIESRRLEAASLVTYGSGRAVRRVHATHDEEAAARTLVVRRIGGDHRKLEAARPEAAPSVCDPQGRRDLLGIRLLAQERDLCLALKDHEKNFFDRDIVGDPRRKEDLLLKDLAFSGRTDEDIGRVRIDLNPDLGWRLCEIPGLIDGAG